MATIASEARTPGASGVSIGSIASAVLSAFGSLKLTVTLFALSMVIVMVGTLAQDDMNMFDVKQRYFLSWIAPLHLDDFLPQAFFPHDKPIAGVVPFPGGALIGFLLMVNLLAAKATRFKIHARGGRLAAGIACLAAGVGIAALVIMAGHNNDGLQGTPPIGYSLLWNLTLAATAALGIGIGAAGSRITNTTVRSLAYGGAAVMLGLVVYSLLSGFRIGDPGLRIVWQLTKGLGAGLVMLVGCKLIFDRQGGNMLLHMGVALLMVGQFAFGDRQLEQNLSLVEGESTNTLINSDAVELAFISESEAEERVVAVPASRLVAAFRDNSIIKDAQLPVDIRVTEYFENSRLNKVGADNPATVGFGLEAQAIEMSKSGGTESEVNVASAYVELLDKETGESLGTRLVSQQLSDRDMLMSEPDMHDSVEVNGVRYKLGLKFHREVKPYWVQLEDVRRINYSGTETPRDYSSFIRIIDNETGQDRRERVWMNNPLRYRGETFYQSNYTSLPGGKEMTGIQVVRNSGWLIPYVACSITAIGLLAHFLGTLSRFLRRREREAKAERAALAEFNLTPPSRWPVFVTVAAFAVFATVMLVPWSAVRYAMRPAARTTQFDWYSAGQIPTQFGGRIMPLDAFARQTLKAVSGKESIPLDDAPAKIAERSDRSKLSAIQWLMEVAAAEPELQDLSMICIDADEVLSELGLTRKLGSKLYSLSEISEGWEQVWPRLKQEVAEKEPRDMTFKERKLVELSQRINQFTLTAVAFRLPVFPDFTDEDIKRVRPDASEQERQRLMINAMQSAIEQLSRNMSSVEQSPAPAIVAPVESTAATAGADQPDWTPFAPAFFSNLREVASAEDASAVAAAPGVESFSDMLAAYAENDTEAFNDAVDEHLASMAGVRGYNRSLVSMERWMQSNWPTGVATILYLSALVMGLGYFLFNLASLRKATWGVLAIAAIVHTIAILCRISITGRAPVINIYSSAVFIGWAAVLFGLLIERIFRYGTGNMLSAATGAITLWVAWGLNTGDTMPVLQAVLDTQFWLATHVISVSLGYVATMVAGFFGIGYLIAGWLGRDSKQLHNLYRCSYGSACFGILFSFVGTVLGGLWADDSWGRFWGWDPKENGALLIVIWNALLLHARWDGMVGPRGFAKLAIGGNIVTAWSYFGTNELGIGLHSYGFTEGALMWLGIFMASQIAFVVADIVLKVTGMRFGKTAA